MRGSHAQGELNDKKSQFFDHHDTKRHNDHHPTMALSVAGPFTVASI
jgi:hypothetical protein